MKNYGKKNKNKLLSKLNFFLICLVLVNFLSLQLIYSEENINSYDYIKLELNSKINFDLILDNPKIKYFRLYDYFIPLSINNSQYINNFTISNKNYKILKNKENIYFQYDYNLNNLKENNIIEKKFIIESQKYMPKINNKINFPYDEIPEKYKEYLEFGDYINYNDKIKKKAVELSYGEDDVFIISTKIANWIRNDINYNLSTIFLKPNQTSTEVFETKQGVCREITNLFASMLRSIGIPVRISIGYAYTNSKEITNYLNSNWGAHAWAEVLVGDTWVPFDLTYNQFGYVDPTHIVTYYGAQEDNKNLEIESKASGITLTNSLKSKNDFKIIDKKKLYNENEFFDFEIDGPKNLSFGSKGYLIIKIKNKKDFYQVLNLRIFTPNLIISKSDQENLIILKPNEKKDIIYKYDIPTNLDNNSIYTFPMSIYLNSYKKKYEINSKKDFPLLNEIPKEILNINDDLNNKKSFSNNKINLNCNLKINSPNNEIFCELFNKNNNKIENIRIKENTSNEIKTLDLGMFENKTIDFKINDFFSTIILKYNNFSEIYNYNFSKPKININYELNSYFNELYVNTSILNFYDNLTLEIFNNDKLIYTKSKEKDNIKIDLNPGENKIDFKLKFKDNLIDKLNLTINEDNKINDPNIKNKELSLIDSIIIYIKNLFNDIL
jgi:hypothetical protein